MRKQNANYYAVGNRCALLLNELEALLQELGILSADNPQKNRAHLLKVLIEEEGFHRIETDPVREARDCLGASFNARALLAEAPEKFNCSSLMAYVYGRCGIRLPRYALSQFLRDPGVSVDFAPIFPGDLIFTGGPTEYWIHNDEQHIGHVGIATENRTIIHAVPGQGVIEESLNDFFAGRDFSGKRRIIPREGGLLILEAPPENEADCSEAYLLKIFGRS